MYMKYYIEVVWWLISINSWVSNKYRFQDFQSTCWYYWLIATEPKIGRRMNEYISILGWENGVLSWNHWLCFYLRKMGILKNHMWEDGEKTAVSPGKLSWHFPPSPRTQNPGSRDHWGFRNPGQVLHQFRRYGPTAEINANPWPLLRSNCAQSSGYSTAAKTHQLNNA